MERTPYLDEFDLALSKYLYDKDSAIRNTRTLVVGCGHVGLPLLAYLRSRGMSACGVDIKHPNGYEFWGRVTKSPFKEEGLQELLNLFVVNVWPYEEFPKFSDQWRSESWVPDNIIITVGTPIDKNHNPDTSQIKSALDSLVKNGLLTSKVLLILRSTLFPGATNWIRHLLKTEYELEPDIAFAPERIAEGHSLKEIWSIPQVIGADSTTELQRAISFFEPLVKEVLPMSSTVSAEFVKLFSNGYRYVNFALANEFAMKCDEAGVSYSEVQNAVNHNYVRGGLAKAALNVGGYCLAKDWCLMSHKSTVPSIVEKAYEVAAKTPVYSATKYKDDIEMGTVGILGLAFKPGSDNPVDSLSYKMIKLVEQLGAFKIYTHDPYIMHPKYGTDLETVLTRTTILFVMTEHECYKDIKPLNEYQKIIRL